MRAFLLILSLALPTGIYLLRVPSLEKVARLAIR